MDKISPFHIKNFRKQTGLSQKAFAQAVDLPTRTYRSYETGERGLTIDKFRELNPLYINITTHHSEFVYRELPNGQFTRNRIRRRPGTVAIAAAIQSRYQLPVIPHLICSGITAEDIEYELLDLQFLGIENLLLLRGDKAKDDRVFMPTPRWTFAYNRTYFAGQSL